MKYLPEFSISQQESNNHSRCENIYASTQQSPTASPTVETSMSPTNSSKSESHFMVNDYANGLNVLAEARTNSGTNAGITTNNCNAPVVTVKHVRTFSVNPSSPKDGIDHCNNHSPSANLSHSMAILQERNQSEKSAVAQANSAMMSPLGKNSNGVPVFSNGSLLCTTPTPHSLSPVNEVTYLTNNLMKMKQEEGIGDSPDISPTGAFRCITSSGCDSVEAGVHSRISVKSDEMSTATTINKSANNEQSAYARASVCSNSGSSCADGTLSLSEPTTAITNSMECVQQQHHIFVFSTQLANRAAELIIGGHFSNLIAYHCTQPATENFLKDFFKNNPRKISTLQRQNIANLHNMSTGAGGQQSVKMCDPTAKTTQRGKRKRANARGLNAKLENVAPIRPSSTTNFTGSPNALGGNEFVSLSREQPDSNLADTRNVINIGLKTTNVAGTAISDVNPASGNLYVSQKSHAALGVGSGDHNDMRLLLQGMKIPDENLTPQQRQHREERLAKLQQIDQFLSSPLQGVNQLGKPGANVTPTHLAGAMLHFPSPGAIVMNQNHQNATTPGTLPSLGDGNIALSETTNNRLLCGGNAAISHTQRSASVPIVTQPPNPASPINPRSNLSLPSPLTPSALATSVNPSNVDVKVFQTISNANVLGKSNFQTDTSPIASANYNKNHNNEMTQFCSNPSTPSSHTSPQTMEPPSATCEDVNNCKASDANQRRNAAPELSQPCHRTANLPLNPNSDRPIQNKLNNSFDPISSLAQMSQHLTNCGPTEAGGIENVNAIGVNYVNGSNSMHPNVDRIAHCNTRIYDNVRMSPHMSGSAPLMPNNYHINPALRSMDQHSLNSNFRDVLRHQEQGALHDYTPPHGMLGSMPMEPRVFSAPSNIEIRASTPNTIQYMPIRPQSRANNNMRMPLNMDLWRYANQQIPGAGNIINNTQTSVHAAGMNLREHNKQLGLIDGRSRNIDFGNMKMDAQSPIVNGARPFPHEYLGHSGNQMFCDSRLLTAGGFPNIHSDSRMMPTYFANTTPNATKCGDSAVPSTVQCKNPIAGDAQSYCSDNVEQVRLKSIDAANMFSNMHAPTDGSNGRMLEHASLLTNEHNSTRQYPGNGPRLMTTNGNMPSNITQLANSATPAACGNVANACYKQLTGRVPSDREYSDQYQNFQQQLYATSTRSQQSSSDPLILEAVPQRIPPFLYIHK